MTIRNPTPLHAGMYEALLQLDPVSYLQQFGCSDEYANFITQSSRAGVYSIIVDKVTVDLKYYGEFSIPDSYKCACVSIECDSTFCLCVHILLSWEWYVEHFPYNVNY